MLSRATTVALVLGSSAAVLVVELVALRLVAPYWGLTLETNTTVIGLALLAIAAGSWAGGRAADVRPPHTLLAPLLGVSGVVVAATPFAVRGAGAVGDPMLFLLAVTGTLVVPGALLSAITPVVTKMHLEDLAGAGSVVGRLSGVSTLGAILGTVLTGFVLVTAIPVTGILVGVGLLLVASALAVGVRTHRAAVVPGLVLVLAAGGASVSSALGPVDCDLETEYHCVDIRADPERPEGRLLVMDGVRHSYVDLADPTYLDFTYARALVGVLESWFPAGEALTAHHLGGGALTIPRYLAATRPGTTGTVSEIDPGLVRTDGGLLDTRAVPGLDVRVEDGRRGLTALPADSLDLVVGDAFGGVSVPWHLTTREALSGVRRVLDDDGLYAANLIDHGALDFARAEAATMQAVFPVVTVLLADDFDGGNVVLVGSERPLDERALDAALAEQGEPSQVLSGDALDAWVGDAMVLTDDHAPVDQLLTPYGRVS